MSRTLRPASLDTLRYLHRALASGPSTIRSLSPACRRQNIPTSHFASFSTSRTLRDSAAAAAQESPSQPSKDDSLKSHTHYHFFPETLPSGPPPHGPFSPDLNKLRREFLQLQARAHPDRHPEDRKAHAQALSARINEAYKTLSSPLLRAQYLLSIRGDDSHSDDAAQLGPAQGDQELILEVLELRERIEELETEAEVEEMKSENDERIEESVGELERAFEGDDLEAAKREAVRLRYWVNVGDVLREWERGKPVVLEHRD